MLVQVVIGKETTLSIRAHLLHLEAFHKWHTLLTAPEHKLGPFVLPIWQLYRRNLCSS